MVDVRMLRERNLALSCLHMLVFGGVLFASTALLPLFMQTQLGYDSRLSGMALSPGGMVVAVLMPIVGFCVSRWDPRALVVGGVVVVAGSLWWLGQFTLAVDFRTIVHVRMLQGLGLAFLFVPINTLVYAGVPREKNNSVSGIVNLARNIGGDIGIASVETLLARRAVFHQNRLVTHLPPTNVAVTDRLALIARALEARGMSAFEAGQRSIASLVREVAIQAQTLAYLDVIFIFAVVVAMMAPLVLLLQRPAKGAAPAAH
jgi:DHA2 family multidrug resistance protein